MRGIRLMAVLAVSLLMTFGGISPASAKEKSAPKKMVEASALPEDRMEIRQPLGTAKKVVLQLIVDNAQWRLLKRSSDQLPELGLVQQLSLSANTTELTGQTLMFTFGPADAGWTLEQVEEHQTAVATAGGNKNSETRNHSVKLGKDDTKGHWMQYTDPTGANVVAWATPIDGQVFQISARGERGKPEQLPQTIAALESGLKWIKLTTSKEVREIQGLLISRAFEGARISFVLPDSWTDRQSYIGAEFEAQRLALTDEEKEPTPAELEGKYRSPARWLGLEPEKLSKRDASPQSIAQDEVERLAKEAARFELLKDPESGKSVSAAKIGKLPVAYLTLNILAKGERQPARRLLCVDRGVLFRLTVMSKAGLPIETLWSDEVNSIFDSVTVGD